MVHNAQKRFRHVRWSIVPFCRSIVYELRLVENETIPSVEELFPLQRIYVDNDKPLEVAEFVVDRALHEALKRGRLCRLGGGSYRRSGRKLRGWNEYYTQSEDEMQTIRSTVHATFAMLTKKYPWLSVAVVPDDL